MIAIVDVGIGNVGSVGRCLKRLKVPYSITSSAEDLVKAEKLILPGVGSFATAMQSLHRFDLISPLKDLVLEKKKPILGICLGMQLFAEKGFEFGETNGLSFISGEVVSFNYDNTHTERSVHMGWNDVQFAKDDPMYRNVKDNACFYFVHSYFLKLGETTQHASSSFGRTLTASVIKNNIWGTQYHPEKSQKSGLQIIKNFCELC